MSSLPSHEHYKRCANMYARSAPGDVVERLLLRMAATMRFWADVTAPHSLHTNGRRRQRRKRGWGEFPSKRITQELPRMVATIHNQPTK